MVNFFKKPPVATSDPFRTALPDDGRTFDEFNANDVAIKIWLPESAERRLKELSDYFSESRSSLLRSIYFVYLYGRYDYEQMRQKSLGLFNEKKLARFSRTVTHRSGPATTPELGKNDEDVKLWLPTKMRDDLQKLADRMQMPLSQLLREALISTLFGHHYLPARPPIADKGA